MTSGGLLLIQLKKEMLANYRAGLILVSMLFVFHGLALAQEKDKDNVKVIAKLTPLSLLTPETPTLGIGAELLLPKFAKHGWAVEFDWGFRCALSPNMYTRTLEGEGLNPDNYYDKHYNKYHLEFRKYMEQSDYLSWYLAAEGFYIPYTYQAKDGFYTGIDSHVYVYDNVHVNKWIKGGALKVGLVLKLTSHFTFEYFGGFGLRFVNVRYSDPVPASHYRSRSIEDYIPQEGKKVAPHMSLGIRFGYRIGVRKKIGVSGT